MPVAKAKTQVQLPEGIVEAVLVQVVDIGTHFSERFKTKSRKVVLVWEIPSFLTSEDTPILISKIYTLSISAKSALKRHVESLLGVSLKEKEFELKNLLGTSALLQLTKEEKNGKERVNITNVLKLPGDKKLEPVHDLISFDMSDLKIPEGVPEWIVDFIQKSEEYTGDLYADDLKNDSDIEPI